MHSLYMAREQVSVAGLRTRLAGVLRAVEHGREVLVTKSGRPIAKLVPTDDDEEILRSVGLHPPRKPGLVPKVPAVSLARGKSLTRTVLEGRK